MRMPQFKASGSSRRETQESDEHVAVDIVTFLADDPQRLSNFFEETGLDPRELRDAVTDGAQRRGIFDYVLGDEPLLIAFATHLGRAPESVARSLARHRGGAGASE